MKRTVAKGFLWVVGTSALVRGVRYLSILFLGGLLAPEDFGRFAAIFVVVNVFALLQGFGLGQALLVRHDRVSEASDTIFLLSAALGIIFLIVALASAPLVEVAFDEEGLSGPYRLCALLVLFRALQTVPCRLFEKELSFRRQFAPGLAGSCAYAAVALVLAIHGARVWALAAAEAAAAFAEMASYWIQSPWRPRARFEWALARADLAFGWVVVGGTALVLVYQSIDRIVIGRMLGTRELGLYAFVFSLASVPASYAVRALNTVLLPSYASTQAGESDRRELFIRATSYAGALGAVFVVGVLALGGRFLEAAYGAKWLSAVRAFSILAFLGLFQSFSSLAEDLVLGLGRPGTFRALSGLRLAIAAAVVWPAAMWRGIDGVAFAMTLAMLVSMVCGWSAALRYVGAPPSAIARALAPPSAAGAAVGLLWVAARRLVPDEITLPQVVALGAGLLSMFVLAWIALDREAREECSRCLDAVRRPKATPGPGSGAGRTG